MAELNTREKLLLGTLGFELALDRLILACEYEKGFLNWQIAHPFQEIFLSKKRQKKRYNKTPFARYCLEELGKDRVDA